MEAISPLELNERLQMEQPEPQHPSHGFALLHVSCSRAWMPMDLLGAGRDMDLDEVCRFIESFDRAKELIIVGGDEGCGNKAALKLMAAGFTQVKYLKGGLSAWRVLNLPQIGTRAVVPWLTGQSGEWI